MSNKESDMIYDCDKLADLHYTTDPIVWSLFNTLDQQTKKGALTSASFALGATALGTIALAIATDNWLITEESTEQFFELENETLRLSFDYVGRIGLWRFCMIYQQESEHCILIDYLRGLKTEKIEHQSTSQSIGEAQMGATPVFLLGLLFMVVATITSIVGNFKADIKTLIASILYINGGLCLAVGILLYITFVNDEASHHAKPTTEPTFFIYRYGWSAYLVGLSFVTSEAAAVVGIYLFMARHSKTEDMVEIIPGLADKINPGTACKNEFKQGYNTLIL